MKNNISHEEIIRLYRSIDFSIHINHEKNIERIKERLVENDSRHKSWFSECFSRLPTNPKA